MQAYTSRCGRGPSFEALKACGWRFLIEPAQPHKTLSPLPYCLDNGAWGCFVRGIPFDAGAFRRCLDSFGSGADWIVLPDIVGDGKASLPFSLSWLDDVSRFGRPMLLAAQDGMTTDSIRPLVRRHGLGVFLGGSTEFKLGTMRDWGTLCRSEGVHFHVARVNSEKRIRLCQDAGANSFDGSSPARFRNKIRRLDHARRQGHLFAGMEAGA